MNDETKEAVKKPKTTEVESAESRARLSPFEEMDRFFENYFPRSWARPLHWEWPNWGEMSRRMGMARVPRVDVLDKDDKVVVRAELPGVDKKDLDISVTDNSVTIKGKTSHEEKEEREDYYRSEIVRGEFSRTVALPSDVDTDKVKSSFKDGMLELEMPKLTKTKRRKIKVD
jgi:HSP20 family protein